MNPSSVCLLSGTVRQRKGYTLQQNYNSDKSSEYKDEHYAIYSSCVAVNNRRIVKQTNTHAAIRAHTHTVMRANTVKHSHMLPHSETHAHTVMRTHSDTRTSLVVQSLKIRGCKIRVKSCRFLSFQLVRKTGATRQSAGSPPSPNVEPPLADTQTWSAH